MCYYSIRVKLFFREMLDFQEYLSFGISDKLYVDFMELEKDVDPLDWKGCGM